jgi:hypothetical protein
MIVRSCLLAFSMLVLFVPGPVGAALTDDEPSNDAIGTPPQMVPTAAVTTDAGEFELTSNDYDYVAIGNLAVGDIVTVSTTPLDDDFFKFPDTMIGLFDSGGARKCDNDDSINNELAQFPGGKGSICRLTIDSAGTWYVGVTGFTEPPFTGNHFELGTYDLHVTINALVPPGPTPTPTASPTVTPTPTPTPTPEPGLLLQLASGVLALAVLGKRCRKAHC